MRPLGAFLQLGHEFSPSSLYDFFNPGTFQGGKEEDTMVKQSYN